MTKLTRGPSIRVYPLTETPSIFTSGPSASSQFNPTPVTLVDNDFFSSITEDDLTDNEWFTFSQQDLEDLRQRSLINKEKNSDSDELSNTLSSVDVDDIISLGSSTIDDLFSDNATEDDNAQTTLGDKTHEAIVINDDNDDDNNNNNNNDNNNDNDNDNDEDDDDLDFDIDSNDSFFNTTQEVKSKINPNNKVKNILDSSNLEN
ncbi:uncharacterized protein SAPINGB_P005456 [Magnusiomyces paraingens]|uniref:Uncharacterized protein n=1 Tax=Magnusiomyces paraingens TaxID=2606893 RepID=A0A5E8BZA7_9ASCO|nr:uncharacterized protein SAPINGB_P005456 [Saprochaete ingens]VVT56969.1 unnamed protein product [Saprochaete ingens]